MVPIAHGNDRAGSIRYPAHVVGVFGIRPTVGRVPSHDATLGFEPTLGTQITNVQGCFARSIPELRVAFEAMSAGDAADPNWIPAASSYRMKPRIGVVTRWPTGRIDPFNLDAVEAAAEALSGQGFDVVDVEIPWLEEAGRLFWALTTSEDAGHLHSLVERFGDRAIIQARRAALTYVQRVDTAAAYVALLQRRSALIRDLVERTTNTPVLVMPVALERPPAVDLDQQGDAAVHAMLRGFGPLTAISLLGLPSLAVPIGFEDGLPRGVQVVSGRFQEELCFAVGDAIARQDPVVWPSLQYG